MKLNKIIWALLPLVSLNACSVKETGSEVVTEEIELVNTYVKGETYSIQLNWDEKISSTDSTGKTQIQDIKMENVMHYEVKDVDNKGTATISGKYVSMKMGDFDSKDSTTWKSDMAMMYQLMASKEITMKIDRKGHVQSVTGAEGLYSMGVPNSPLDDNKIMQENIEGSIGFFPDKKVKKGDTWERTYAISFGYPCIYHDTYTLKEVRDSMATIEVSSKMEPNKEALPTYFPGGVELHQELNGTQSGTYMVDITKGKITQTDCMLKISGKATGKMGDKPLEIIMSTELGIKTKVIFPGQETQ